eukprot:XP_014768641.1 PREDICTED: uncharacterized protein LOC106868045 [Octopus bimaculoides]
MNDIADVVGLLNGLVQAILMFELNMLLVSTKFVPHLLTTEQKEHRVDVCQDLRQRAADDSSFMSRIITGDECWVYMYDPETKQHPSQWKSPSPLQPKKARQSCRFDSSIGKRDGILRCRRKDTCSSDVSY